MDVKLCNRVLQFKMSSDFILDFRKLPFPSHLGKPFIKIGKISAKIHEIGKIKAIFGLGTTPILGCKNGQIKSMMSNSTAGPPACPKPRAHSISPR